MRCGLVLALGALPTPSVFAFILPLALKPHALATIEPLCVHACVCLPSVCGTQKSREKSLKPDALATSAQRGDLLPELPVPVTVSSSFAWYSRQLAIE